MTLAPVAALRGIPAGLRQELTSEFEKITRNYRERRWRAAELHGGRLCEVVYTILEGHLNGNKYAATASKPSRFNDACKKLESKPSTAGSDSARLTIPRMLVGMYEMRNRREVGHVGGDVSANHMDATVVLHMSQWIMAELVRIFHNVAVDEAARVVEALVDRTVPILWQVGDVTRILDTRLSLDEGTLLLLYSEVLGVHETKLAESLEQDRIGNYRRVLQRLHAKRLIEYSNATGVAVISPLGVKDVEEWLL